MPCPNTSDPPQVHIACARSQTTVTGESSSAREPTGDRAQDVPANEPNPSLHRKRESLQPPGNPQLIPTPQPLDRPPPPPEASPETPPAASTPSQPALPPATATQPAAAPDTAADPPPSIPPAAPGHPPHRDVVRPGPVSPSSEPVPQQCWDRCSSAPSVHSGSIPPPQPPPDSAAQCIDPACTPCAQSAAETPDSNHTRPAAAEPATAGVEPG
jgi:hypothetical protein